MCRQSSVKLSNTNFIVFRNSRITVYYMLMDCLRPLEPWDRGLESHSRHGRLSTFFLCLCCAGSRLVMG
jgi:hypothetical protein